MSSRQVEILTQRARKKAKAMSQAGLSPNAIAKQLREKQNGPARREMVIAENIVVREPEKQTEFEIQAMVWSGLRSMGLNARGEVHACFSGRAKCRFDVAVFDWFGKLIGIVECKDSTRRSAFPQWRGTRQGRRYEQFGVPVRLVRGFDEAQMLLLAAKAGTWPCADATKRPDLWLEQDGHRATA